MMKNITNYTRENNIIWTYLLNHRPKLALKMDKDYIEDLWKKFSTNEYKANYIEPFEEYLEEFILWLETWEK